MIDGMLRCALVALSLGAFATPLAAQQVGSDQGSTPPPSSAQLPPPPPVPPPLPPMPSTRHRWVSIGHHSTAHHAAAHHAVAHHGTAHRSKAHHRTTRHSRARHHEAASSAAKTMRWCSKLTPRQMLRHSACKAMLHAYRED